MKFRSNILEYAPVMLGIFFLLLINTNVSAEDAGPTKEKKVAGFSQTGILNPSSKNIKGVCVTNFVNKYEVSLLNVPEQVTVKFNGKDYKQNFKDSNTICKSPFLDRHASYLSMLAHDSEEFRTSNNFSGLTKTFGRFPDQMRAIVVNCDKLRLPTLTTLTVSDQDVRTQVRVACDDHTDSKECEYWKSRIPAASNKGAIRIKYTTENSPNFEAIVRDLCVLKSNHVFSGSQPDTKDACEKQANSFWDESKNPKCTTCNANQIVEENKCVDKKALNCTDPEGSVPVKAADGSESCGCPSPSKKVTARDVRGNFEICKTDHTTEDQKKTAVDICKKKESMSSCTNVLSDGNFPNGEPICKCCDGDQCNSARTPTPPPTPEKPCPTGQKKNDDGVCEKTGTGSFLTKADSEKKAYCENTLRVRYDPSTKDCAAPTNPNGNQNNGQQPCPQGYERVQGSTQCFPKKPEGDQPKPQAQQQGSQPQQPQQQPQYNPFQQQPYQSPFLNALTQQMTCNAFELVNGYIGQVMTINQPFRVRWDVSNATTGQKLTTAKVQINPSEAVRYNQSEQQAEILPKKTGKHTIKLAVTNVQMLGCSDITVDVQADPNSSSQQSNDSYGSESYQTSEIDSSVPQTETIADAQRAVQASKAKSVPPSTTTKIATYEDTTPSNYDGLCATFGIGCAGTRTVSTVLADPIHPNAMNEGGTTDVLVVPKDRTITDNYVASNTETRVTKGYFNDENLGGQEDQGGEFVGAGNVDATGSSSSSGLAKFFDDNARVQETQGSVSDDTTDSTRTTESNQPGILSRFWNWVKSWFQWG